MKKPKTVRQERRAFQCIRMIFTGSKRRRELQRWIKRYGLVVALLLLFLLWFSFPWLLANFPLPAPQIDFPTAGQSGDMFGSLNTLFSGLAFAGVLLALWMQRQDLNLQRKEMASQTKQFERQVEITAYQTLYSALPSYIQQANEQRESCMEGMEAKVAIHQISGFVLDEIGEVAQQEVFNSEEGILQNIHASTCSASEHLLHISPWADVFMRWFRMVDDLVDDEEKNIDFKRMLYSRLDDKELYLLWLSHIIEMKAIDVRDEKHIPLSSVHELKKKCKDWESMELQEQGRTAYLTCRLLKNARKRDLGPECLGNIIISASEEYNRTHPAHLFYNHD